MIVLEVFIHDSPSSARRVARFTWADNGTVEVDAEPGFEGVALGNRPVLPAEGEAFRRAARRIWGKGSRTSVRITDDDNREKKP